MTAQSFPQYISAPRTMKGWGEWWKYVHDEHYDCVICPSIRGCTIALQTQKVTGNMKVICRFSQENARYTPKHKELYRRRNETIERGFAGTKEKHAIHYTRSRGLAHTTNWLKLQFDAMNLKNWLDGNGRSIAHLAISHMQPIYERNPACA